MKNVILFVGFLVLIGCEDLPFTDEDTQNNVSTEKPETVKQQNDEKIENLQEGNNLPSEEQNISINKEVEPQITENIPSAEKTFSKDEITLISEELNLTGNTVIQNRKVVLNGAMIKTFEHDLTIIAEEFVSNHSIIQNFPEEQWAKKDQEGKHGGNILIEAEIAKGKLQLFLNGENGGHVPRGRYLSKEEQDNFKGRDGKDGKNAFYEISCRVTSTSKSEDCLEKCFSHPTEGESGGDGLQGIPGSDGKNGGNSGSFHLRTFDFSNFHLTNVQNKPGIGSEGGRGSVGGRGGRAGRNGWDSKKLCNKLRSFPKRGKNGKRGEYGRNGENGKAGTVCFETLLQDGELETIQMEMTTICKAKGENCREELVQKKENIKCY